METAQKRPSGDGLGSDEPAAKRQHTIALDGLASAQAALTSAQAALTSTRELATAWEKQVVIELQAGNKAEVKEAEAKVKEAEAKVTEAEAKVNEAEAKVEKAEAKVEKAEASIAGLPPKRSVKATDLDFAHSQGPAMTRGGCPRECLVGVKTCTVNCLEVISEEQKKDTRMTDPRTRPLMLSRCMRGGKTTMLLELFDQLKNNNANVIFISFNGDSPIKQLKGETKLETMTRAIAVALMPPMEQEERDNLHCPRKVIEEFLKHKDCVLLVDELHVLLHVTKEDSCEELGAFLRGVFLDPSSRHLTFSTHLPSTAGINQLLGKGKGSSRSAVAAPMPESSNLTELRAMHPACGTLTPCEVAYYSCIPSLIYTVKVYRYDFEKRFQELNVSDDGKDALTKDFLEEFFSGTRLPGERHLRAFDSLTLCPEDGQVRWVLGYAGLMCNYLGIHDVAEQVKDLMVQAKTVDHGKDWEVITQIALALRCVEAKYSSAHELVGLPKGLCPKLVSVEMIPAHLRMPTDALQWWKAQDKAVFPCVATLIPQSASFEIFDSMVAWQKGADAQAQAVGHQSKLTKERPEKEAPDGMRGFLLRGDAPKRASPVMKFNSWKYPSKKELISFLGSSLAPSYPANWCRESAA